VVIPPGPFLAAQSRKLEQEAAERRQAIHSTNYLARIAEASTASEFYDRLNRRIKLFDDSLDADQLSQVISWRQPSVRPSGVKRSEISEKSLISYPVK
jgi:hypothetical protein